MKLSIRRFGRSCHPMLKAANFGKNCSSLYGRWSWIHQAIARQSVPCGTPTPDQSGLGDRAWLQKPRLCLPGFFCLGPVAEYRLQCGLPHINQAKPKLFLTGSDGRGLPLKAFSVVEDETAEAAFQSAPPSNGDCK